jgi:hypothetical protein
MKKMILFVFGFAILTSVLTSTGQAASPTFVFGSQNPPLTEAQVTAAKKAAIPVGVLYAQNGIPEHRLRRLQGLHLTIFDPRSTEAIADLKVIEIARKNGISRVAVRGIVNGVTESGQIKWAVNSFRVLMDISPEGEIIGTPELNHFNNLLTSDNGRFLAHPVQQ